MKERDEYEQCWTKFSRSGRSTLNKTQEILRGLTSWLLGPRNRGEFTWVSVAEN